MTTYVCPPRDELHAYAAGNLNGERSEEIDTHLDECQVCQDKLETYSNANDTFVSRLRRPEVHFEFLREVACFEMMQRVERIASEPSFHGALRGKESTKKTLEYGTIGPYRLLAKLGAGGMGTVYKALHTKLKWIVALKTLPAERLVDDIAVARFEREMEAVARLDHPNIVRAKDAGVADGKHYFAMEYVDGVDLSDLSHRLGPLAFADGCELIRQAAVGLQHAHQQEMVHRDIKPSNLMLTSGQSSDQFEGTAIVKILDLGLALLPQTGDPDRELTSTGQAMGTLDYMAPEQGDNSHEVDIRADIYSLGATLFKLLTGEAPFGGDVYKSPVRKLTALATQPAPSLAEKRPDASPSLVALVDRLLAKNPCERPATPQEVADALVPFIESADLARLLQAARDQGENQIDAPASQIATDDYLKSEFVSTQAAPQRPAIVVSGSRRKAGRPLLTAIGLAGLIVLGAVFYLRVATGVLRIEASEDFDTKDLVILVDDEQITLQNNSWTGRRWARKHRLAVKIGSARLDVGPDAVFRLADSDVEHRLSVQLDDATLSSNYFELARGRETVLTISFERRLNPELPQQATSALTENATPSIAPAVEVTAPFVKGVWRFDGESLVTEGLPDQNQLFLFGDPNWQDYDLSVEVMEDKKGERGEKSMENSIIFLADEQATKYWKLDIGAFNDSRHFDLLPMGTGSWPWKDPARRYRANRLHGNTGVWYAVTVKVRQGKVSVLVDGEEVATSEHSQLLHGRVGAGSYNIGQARWRNFEVRTPDGQLLWKGWPDLSGTGIEPPRSARSTSVPRDPSVADSRISSAKGEGTEVENGASSSGLARP